MKNSHTYLVPTEKSKKPQYDLQNQSRLLGKAHIPHFLPKLPNFQPFKTNSRIPIMS